MYGLTAVLLVLGRGDWGFCVHLFKFIDITVLWINELTVMFLVQVREKMAVLPAVTGVPLLNNAMDKLAD